MELQIVKLLEKRDDYQRYIPLVVLDRLGEEVSSIIKSLDSYYTETGDNEVKWDDWYTWYTSVKHPNLSATKADILKRLSADLKSMTGVSAVVLRNFILRDHAAQLGDVALELVDGNTKYTIGDADDIVLSCLREVDKVDGLIAGRHMSSDDVKDQLVELASGTTYDWRLNELQLSVGPIQQGDLIVVGARPDSGKTTFLASEITYMAKQLNDGECILWFNNEERLSRVRGRQVQAALNWTREECLKDLDKTADAYAKAIGGDSNRLRVYDKTIMSVTDIDRAIQRYQPKIIVIDQLWKLRGFEHSSTSDIDRFTQIIIHLRNIAKNVGPVIGTTQIDDKAEGERYPTMARLYNSKTAVQGEADVIILIGRDHNEPDGVRFIKAPKNKLTLGNNKYRNAGWAVGIDQTHARFTSNIPRPTP